MTVASRIMPIALAAACLLSFGCNSTPQAEQKPAAIATTPAPATNTDSTPSITPAPGDVAKKWSTEQILTCTFRQCWELSGKNEDAFFDIVQQLAVMSANDRGITLPTTEEAGRKAGEYIRAQAKIDNQQLLYAVVDAAVRKQGS